MKEGCRTADAGSVDLSQEDTHTSPIWQECPWAQLELVFHITLKFLNFREQPYKGGTVQIRGEEWRGKRLGRRGMEIFTFPHIKDKMFHQSYHSKKILILTREYLPKSEAPVLFPSISMWGGFWLLFFFFSINLFLLPNLIFLCFVFICFVLGLFNFLSPFAALRMQADLFPATKLLHTPSRVSFHTEQNSSCQDARLR